MAAYKNPDENIGYKYTENPNPDVEYQSPGAGVGTPPEPDSGLMDQQRGYYEQAQEFGPDNYDIGGYDERRREVGSEELAGNRLGMMLDENGILMRRAAQQGRDWAGSRGLMNTSIAAGAARGSMIDRATPFALDEAGAYQKAASENLAAGLRTDELNLTGDISEAELNARRDEQFRAHALGGEEDLRRAMLNIENREDTQMYGTREREAGQTFTTGERLSQQEFTWTLAQLDAELKREGVSAQERGNYLQAWAMVQTGKFSSIGDAFAAIYSNPKLKASEQTSVAASMTSKYNALFDDIFRDLPPMPDFDF